MFSNFFTFPSYFNFIYTLFIFSKGGLQTEIASKRKNEVIYMCTSHWLSFSYQMYIFRSKRFLRDNVNTNGSMLERISSMYIKHMAGTSFDNICLLFIDIAFLYYYVGKNDLLTGFRKQLSILATALSFGFLWKTVNFVLEVPCTCK